MRDQVAVWDEVNTSLTLHHLFIVLFTWKTMLILHEQATSPALPSTCELVPARAFEVYIIFQLEVPCSPEVIICGSPNALRSRTTHALCLSLPSPCLSCQKLPDLISVEQNHQLRSPRRPEAPSSHRLRPPPQSCQSLSVCASLHLQPLPFTPLSQAPFIHTAKTYLGTDIPVSSWS